MPAARSRLKDTLPDVAFALELALQGERRVRVTVSRVIVRNIGLRQVLVAGAMFGAAAGGTVATVNDGMSGPAFWTGIAVGALIGAICLAAVAVVFDVVQALRRASHRT